MWVQVAALRCTTLSARAGRLPGTHPGHIQPDAQKFELRWRRPPPPRRRHAYGSQGWSLEANLGGRALRARRALANAHSDLRAAEPASPNLKHAPPAAAPGPARCGVRPAPSPHACWAAAGPRSALDLPPPRPAAARGPGSLELRCLLPAASSPLGRPVSSRRLVQASFCGTRHRRTSGRPAGLGPTTRYQRAAAASLGWRVSEEARTRSVKTLGLAGESFVPFVRVMISHPSPSE